MIKNILTITCILLILSGIVHAQYPAGGVPGAGIPGQPSMTPSVSSFTGQSVSSQTAPAASAQPSSQPTQTGVVQPQTPSASPLQQLITQQHSPTAPQQLSNQQAQALQGLTPEQQNMIQTEMSKTGGVLTPEAMEALKNNPAFKGLSPEDIMKAKEQLAKQTIERKPFEELNAKKVIEEPGKEESGLFERFRTIGAYQDISLNIRPFGYSFFREATIAVSTDRKDIPVPGKYIVGPGDEVRILLWGRVNANYNLVVDRNGNITVPQIGPISVAGQTFEDMSKTLIKQSEQIVGANVDITMGSLKTIPIFVLGDVRRPGSYTIGSFATITDALLIAGGPSNIGSMRNIQLKRKDKVITTFDLYDFFLRGDKSKDTIVQAGDVIFIPVAGPVIGIAGNVKRPAIYELKNKHDLQTVFDMAGGIIPTAFTQQIQVERIVKNEKQIVVDIDDKHLMKTRDFLLQDADLIKVFNIVEKESNVVFINGNIKRPGKYEYKPGMHIRDLVKDVNDLLDETYFDYALIKRLALPDMRTEFIPFNLGWIINEKDAASNIELKPMDNIYIFSKWFFRDRPFIVVDGEVRKPGKYDLLQNATVKDIILLAGDLTRDAYPEKAEIIRRDKNKDYKIIYFDIAKAIANDPVHNIVLQDEDKIVVHSIWGYKHKKTVTIDGEVFKPGTYPYVENMRVKDIVFMAGNTLDSAYLDAVGVSFQIVDEEGTKIEHVTIDLKKALAGDPENNILLQPYSRCFVKKIPRWRDEEFVRITGEVKFPGRYIIKKGETLSSVIERAGGYSDKAFLRGAVFTRTRVKELQQQSINDIAVRLERDLVSDTNMRLSTAISPEEIDGLKAQQEGTQKLIDAMRRTQATGRMAIALAHLRLLKGSEYDVALEDGDSLHIPTRNEVVNVAGSVMAQGTYLYGDSIDYNGYIEKAGGFTKYADPKNIFILKVDGTAMKIATGFMNWSSSKSRWEMAAFGEEIKQIEPGDTIVVPGKIETTAWLRGIKDITQVLMQMALTGASINYMFK